MKILITCTCQNYTHCTLTDQIFKGLKVSAVTNYYSHTVRSTFPNIRAASFPQPQTCVSVRQTNCEICIEFRTVPCSCAHGCTGTAEGTLQAREQQGCLNHKWPQRKYLSNYKLHQWQWSITLSSATQ